MGRYLGFRWATFGPLKPTVFVLVASTSSADLRTDSYIIDNDDPRCHLDGNGFWPNPVTTNPGYYGANYHPGNAYKLGGSGKAVWQYENPNSGYHEVHVRWTSSETRTEFATYSVYHDGGVSQFTVNQKERGGLWNKLGTFSGVTKIELSNEAPDQTDTLGWVIVDAVKVTPYILDENIIDNSDPRFRMEGDGWWPTGVITYPGYYGDDYQPGNSSYLGGDPGKAIWEYFTPKVGLKRLYARWSSSATRTQKAQYTIYHGIETTEVIVNQQYNGGAWIELGVFNDLQKVELSNLASDQDGTSKSWVIADAIKTEDISNEIPQAIIIDNVDPRCEITGEGWYPAMLTTYPGYYGSNYQAGNIVNFSSSEGFTRWKFYIPVVGTYQVLTNWSQGPTRTTQAKYSIYHKNGSSVVYQNQQINGGSFQELGNYDFESGEYYVELSNQAADQTESQGWVIVDAVKIEFVAFANRAPEMAGDQSFTVDEDNTLSITLNGANDPDGDNLSYQLISEPQVGSLTECLNNDGDLDCIYTPTENFNGVVNFRYKAFDGESFSTGFAEVTIEVAPVNDKPIIGDDQFVNATIEQTKSFVVNAAIDVDGDTLTYEIVEGTSNGTLTNCFQSLGDNSCQYTPVNGFSGTDRFTYRVKDSEFTADRVAEVILTVDPSILQIEVEQIESGDYHTCVLLNNGKIRCWGDNSYGQLGYGNLLPVGSAGSPYDHIYEAGSVLLEERAVKISLGRKHTCVLLESGRIKCWGSNSEGQTGGLIFTSYGDEESELPIYLDDVALEGPAVDLWSGEYNNCAKMMSGEIKCWGSFGIGSSMLVTPSANKALDLLGTVSDLSLGYKHGCALISGGVKCWGEDGSGPEHTLGQLGNESVNDIAPANATFVALGGNVTQFSTHKDHSCALLDSGTVRCFGSNYTGQLGQGIKDHVGNGVGPSIISLGDISLGGQASYIKVGPNHSCAIINGGDVRCWGKGDKGQLGYGGSETVVGDNELPTDIDTVALGVDAISLSLGLQHTCVLLDTKKVRCFGNGENGKGALGYGNDQNIGLDILPNVAGDLSIIDATPNGVNAGIDFATQTFTAYRIVGSVVVPEGDIPQIKWSKIIGPDGVHFSDGDKAISSVRFIYPGEYILRLESIIDGDSYSDYVNVTVTESSKQILSLGKDRTCRVRIDGTGECLGGGILASIAVVPTLIPSLEQVTDISSNSTVSCVVESGKVRCWGVVHASGTGVDGAGYSYDKFEVIGIDNAISVATSGNSACALLNDGKIKCWGKVEASDWGILGDGTRTDSLLPVEVANIDNATNISMGSQHACALLDTGKISCWGKAAVPGIFLLNAPAEVSSLENVISMDTGDFQTCAITDRIHCWGFVNAPNYALIEIANSSNAVQVTSGREHVCYISDTKNVWCFGDNSKGQLGTGDTISSTVPVLVPDLENIVELKAGRDHTCAYSDENEFYCWGDNSSNQMGNINSEIITIPTLLFNEN